MRRLLLTIGSPSLMLAVISPTLALGASGLFGNLSTVVSTGALGNFSQYTYGDGNSLNFFNTDNGQITTPSSGGYLEATLPHTTVQEYPGGPTINVYNFTNFDSPVGDNYTIIGGQPAVIAVTGSVTIGGIVQVDSGGGAGGPGGYLSSTYNQGPGYAGSGPGGGAGGPVVGNVFSPSIYGGYSGSSGGGGGSVSPGLHATNGTPQNGAGGPFVGYETPGGAGGSAQDTSILQGGGGGGGGAGANLPGETYRGGTGGAGGGALFFITPNNFTIDSNASLNANGNIGITSIVNDGGSGGGGGGGEIWIDAGGTFLNQGGLDAIGGAGGNAGASLAVGGSGSGGEFIIDAADIINNDTISVADGTGAGANGGNVDLMAPSIQNNGSIVGVVPEPATGLIALAAFGFMLLPRRRRSPLSRDGRPALRRF